jgi:FkbM family methyltransferase
MMERAAAAASREQMDQAQIGLPKAAHVGGIAGFATRARDSIQMYYHPFGIRGFVAFLTNRLFGFPIEITAKPAGYRHPVHLRMRTSDPPGYDEILLRGQYAIDIPFIPKVIVDIGANIGMASVYYAHRYPEARIVAVEPEASNFALLVRNVRAYSNILSLNAALWHRDGEAELGFSGRPGETVGYFVREGEGPKVRTLTFPTLMREVRIQSVDLLKVDIEGAEKEVFESCDWIDRVRCLVIELHDRVKLGCSAAVNSVTGDFQTSQQGEVTVYIRRS